MSSPDKTLKTDMNMIAAWAVLLPVLTAWPFLSVMPLFTLIGGGQTVLMSAIYIVLLVTGFWAVAGIFLAYSFVLSDGARAAWTPSRGTRGLILGGYAAVWTTLYLIVAVAAA